MKKTIKVDVYVNGNFYRKTSVTAKEGGFFWDVVREKLFSRFENGTIGGQKPVLTFNATSKVLSITESTNFD